MSLNIAKDSKKRVVIVGGGFGGLKLANKLKKSGFQVVLIDKNNYHQFPPLIYQVASAGMEPTSISFPFRKIFQHRKDFYFRMAEVRAIFPEKNLIQTSIGKAEYDYLVLAAGTTTNFFGNKHIEEEAMPMKNVSEAMGLRNALLANLERAVTCSNKQEQQELLNVVVVGGGATGVEVAGVLSEMKKFVLPNDYPDMPSSLMHIYLIEAGPRLLAGMSEDSSSHAEQFLLAGRIGRRGGGVAGKLRMALRPDHDGVAHDDHGFEERLLFPYVHGIGQIEVRQLGLGFVLDVDEAALHGLFIVRDPLERGTVGRGLAHHELGLQAAFVVIGHAADFGGQHLVEVLMVGLAFPVGGDFFHDDLLVGIGNLEGALRAMVQIAQHFAVEVAVDFRIQNAVTAELAHAAGFAVMAHANGDRAVMAALQAGVDSIEHGAYLSESVLLRMAQQRTLWVPTLSTIGNLIGSGRYPDAVLKRLLAQQQEAVRFVAAHGGRIGLGSDAGAWHVMHGQAISDELGYLTAALGPRTEPLLLEAEAYASVTFCRK